jgi:hypothetical protein
VNAAGPNLKVISTMSVGYGNIAIQSMHGDKEELTTWHLRACFAALASQTRDSLWLHAGSLDRRRGRSHCNARHYGRSKRW